MELEQLYQALRNADALAQQGDQQAAADARRIAAMIQQAEGAQAAQPQPQEQMGLPEDLARSAASGLAIGTEGLINLPGQVQRGGLGLAMRGLERIGLVEDAEAELQNAMQFLGNVRLPFGLSARFGQTDIGGATEAALGEDLTAYEPQTNAGQYTQTGFSFVPGAALPFDEFTLIPRLIRGAAVPGVASEFAGQATEALGGGETAQNMARIAAAIGAPMALGAAEAGVRRGLVEGARAYEPGSERAAAVRTLDDMGVDGLTSGARLGSERLIRAEGAEDVSREAVSGINRAVMRLLGSDAQRPTRQALGAVEDRLGSVFDEAGNLAAVPPQSALNTIQRSFDDYMNLQTQAGARVPPALDDIGAEIADAALSGRSISGAQVQNWRRQLRRLAETAERSDRGDIADFARGMSSALDDVVLTAAQQANDPDLYQRLLSARNQYRDLRTVASALNRAGPEARSGVVSPGALATAVRRIEGERAVVQRPTSAPLRPLSQLALAGEEVASSLPTVSSGGRRTVGLEALLSGAVPAASATALGATPEIVGGAALAGFLAPRASQMAVRSPYVQQMLLRDPTLRGALAQQAGLLGQIAPGVMAQQNVGPR